MIIFIISLVLIIIIHELSHLFTALFCKADIEVISIGFGKPFYSFYCGNIRCNITPYLFGGYVQLKDEMKFSKEKDAFTNLTYTKKVAIALAGVIVNVILGLLCAIVALKINYYTLFYFGLLSLMLGISNALPIPGLDGSYPIFILLEKFFNKEKLYAVGNKLFSKIIKILIIINIVTIPWFIFRGIKMMNQTIEIAWYLYKNGVL